MPELPANPALSALQDRLNAELRETRYRVTLAEDGPLPFELRAYLDGELEDIICAENFQRFERECNRTIRYFLEISKPGVAAS